MNKEQFVVHLTLFGQNLNGDGGKLLEEDELVGTTTYTTYERAKYVYDKYTMDGPDDDASLLVITHQQRRLLRDVLAEACRSNEDARQQVEMRVFQGLHVQPEGMRKCLNDEWESLRTIFNMVN